MLNYNTDMHIALVSSRYDKNYKVEEWNTTELYGRLKRPAVDQITTAEYMNLPAEKKTALKDKGGYTIGKPDSTTRKGATFMRDALTIDIDELPERTGILGDMEQSINPLECGYFWHTTRKSTPDKPRCRLIIPLSRAALPDEYSALIHAVGALIGPLWVDPSTDQPDRLMFWPSICRDGHFQLGYRDAPALDIDTTLQRCYNDWTDISTWAMLGPEKPQETTLHERAAAIPRTARKIRVTPGTLQADPFTKSGLVGAFCRLYPVPAAIESFLSDTYAHTMENRYTYLGPTTSTRNGAAVYDNGRFLYSYHATDPNAEILMNSWDLVRRCKFGDDTVSNANMENWVRTNLPDVVKEEVIQRLAKKRFK